MFGKNLRLKIADQVFKQQSDSYVLVSLFHGANITLPRPASQLLKTRSLTRQTPTLNPKTHLVLAEWNPEAVDCNQQTCD